MKRKEHRRRARPVRVRCSGRRAAEGCARYCRKGRVQAIILTSTDKKPWTAGGFRAYGARLVRRRELLVLPTMTFGDGRDTARTHRDVRKRRSRGSCGGIRNIVCRKADDCVCQSVFWDDACAGNPDPSDLKLGLNATVTAVKQAKLESNTVLSILQRMGLFLAI